MGTTPKLSPGLVARFQRHCAALYRGGAGPAPQGHGVSGQGTVTFVAYRGMCLGITNHHVVEPASGKPLCIALDEGAPHPGRLVLSSERSSPELPLDIAVFELDSGVLEASGKVPFPVGATGVEIREGDVLVAAGYPGRLRALSGGRVEHAFYCIAANCVGLSDRRIILHDENGAQVHKIPFGGMSGGPIYSPGDGGNYELVGIVYQGRGLGETDENGGISPDTWIYGFPLTPGLLDRVLDLSALR